jgi:hypothetical protein
MTGIGGIVAGIGFRAVAGKAIANAKSDFAAIPPKVKLALLAIALLAVAVIVHQRFAHKAIRAAELAGEATGEARANAAWSAQVRQAKAAAETARLKAEALSRSIANQERTRHEEAASTSALVRGAGDRERRAVTWRRARRCGATIRAPFPGRSTCRSSRRCWRSPAC